jgi:hypothetical protein
MPGSAAKEPWIEATRSSTGAQIGFLAPLIGRRRIAQVALRFLGALVDVRRDVAP